MFNNYKVVCVTPAGRRRYMKLLAPYILSNDIVDRWDIWINTTNPRDISFFEYLAKNFPKISLIPQPDGIIDGNASINGFFRYCVEKDTVYIRFDDDIIWIEPHFFEKFVNYRIQNKDYFLTFPLIINNAICSHLLMCSKKFKTKIYIKACADDKFAWANPKFAYELHTWFLNYMKTNSYKDLYIPNKIIALNRFSINCMSWLGDTFVKFNGIVLGDEEEYLTVIKPAELGLCNCIVGDVLVSHFAFFTQREYLDRTDILSQYEVLLKKNTNKNIVEIYKIIEDFGDFRNDEQYSTKGLSKWKIFKRRIARLKVPVIQFMNLGELYRKVKYRAGYEKFIDYDFK